MDDLDFALLDAWTRLAPRIRADRIEGARRARRRDSATLTGPLRAWCLCVRASDSRLESLGAVAPYRALRFNAPHTLYLDARAIRTLTAPVRIDWPGVRARRAADILGREATTINKWIARGVFRVHYDPATMHGHRGRPVPVVWSPSPLDPNANLAKAPDPVWGAMWQYHHTRVPDDLTLIVNREITLRTDSRPTRREAYSRGWQFICPGLPVSAGGQAASGTGRIRFVDGRPEWPEEPEDHPPITCGRHVGRLYCPLPIIDLPHLLGDDPLGAALDDSMPRAVGPSFFACKHCHRVRYTNLQGARGWNTIVAHLSRGLLYGREVERPALAEYKRKRRYAPYARRAPQRERVLALLLRGLTIPQIGAELGISRSVVDKHVGAIYRAHSVHSRGALFRELGVARPRTLSRRMWATRDVLVEGLTYAQGAARLGVPLGTFEARVSRLYRVYGVHSREGLRDKLRPETPLPDAQLTASDGVGGGGGMGGMGKAALSLAPAVPHEPTDRLPEPQKPAPPEPAILAPAPS